MAARTTQTHQNVQISLAKKTHEMQTQLLDMLLQPAQAVLPPGQGEKIDKSA
jgi:hypothetical protein